MTAPAILVLKPSTNAADAASQTVPSAATAPGDTRGTHATYGSGTTRGSRIRDNVRQASQAAPTPQSPMAMRAVASWSGSARSWTNRSAERVRGTGGLEGRPG